jgi:hypothetical protein
VRVVWEERRQRKADRRREERTWRERWRHARVYSNVVAFLLGVAVAWTLAWLTQDGPTAGGAREERTPPPGLPEETRPAPSGEFILTAT